MRDDRPRLYAAHAPTQMGVHRCAAPCLYSHASWWPETEASACTVLWTADRIERVEVEEGAVVALVDELVGDGVPLAARHTRLLLAVCFRSSISDCHEATHASRA
jgi:hypothetical protein